MKAVLRGRDDHPGGGRRSALPRVIKQPHSAIRGFERRWPSFIRQVQSDQLLRLPVRSLAILLPDGKLLRDVRQKNVVREFLDTGVPRADAVDGCAEVGGDSGGRVIVRCMPNLITLLRETERVVGLPPNPTCQQWEQSAVDLRR